MHGPDNKLIDISRSKRLLSLYHNLHAVVHARNAHLKVHHCISRDAVSLAWVTPLFELYCVAGPNANRNALAHNANKVVQWAHREEERIFIIGGAVRGFPRPSSLLIGNGRFSDEFLVTIGTCPQEKRKQESRKTKRKAAAQNPKF